MCIQGRSDDRARKVWPDYCRRLGQYFVGFMCSKILYRISVHGLLAGPVHVYPGHDGHKKIILYIVIVITKQHTDA